MQAITKEEVKRDADKYGVNMTDLAQRKCAEYGIAGATLCFLVQEASTPQVSLGDVEKYHREDLKRLAIYKEAVKSVSDPNNFAEVQEWVNANAGTGQII